MYIVMIATMYYTCTPSQNRRGVQSYVYAIILCALSTSWEATQALVTWSSGTSCNRHAESGQE